MSNVLGGESGQRNVIVAATSSTHTDSKVSGMRWLALCEHSDLATLLVLRWVCRPFKQAADIRIGITSHLPMLEVEYEKLLGHGHISRCELSTASNDDAHESGEAIKLWPQWRAAN